MWTLNSSPKIGLLLTVPRCWGAPIQVTSSGNSSGWDFHLVSDAFFPAYPMGLIRSQRNTKIRRAPDQNGHQVPVLPHQLTKPIPGFASRPQPMFSAQGHFGLPPLCGRMGYLTRQLTQLLRLGPAVQIIRCIHQRRTSFSAAYV